MDVLSIYQQIKNNDRARASIHLLSKCRFARRIRYVCDSSTQITSFEEMCATVKPVHISTFEWVHALTLRFISSSVLCNLSLKNDIFRFIPRSYITPQIRWQKVLTKKSFVLRLFCFVGMESVRFVDVQTNRFHFVHFLLSISAAVLPVTILRVKTSNTFRFSFILEAGEDASEFLDAFPG